jgi:hypothetical protein
MIVCQLNHPQHKKHFPLNINISKPSGTLITMLFIIFLCFNYNANGSTTALSRKGPFYSGNYDNYSDTFSYTNQYTNRLVGFSYPFNGWQFYNSMYPMPSNYLSISIQSI